MCRVKKGLPLSPRASLSVGQTPTLESSRCRFLIMSKTRMYSHATICYENSEEPALIGRIGGPFDWPDFVGRLRVSCSQPGDHPYRNGNLACIRFSLEGCFGPHTL